MQADSSDFDLKERLVDKSFDAYVLALETINRITVRYRMEAFCYLICNAWKLLRIVLKMSISPLLPESWPKALPTFSDHY